MSAQAAPPPWWRSRSVIDIATLFVAIRLILGVLALWFWWAQEVPGPCNFELARNGWTEIPPLADGPVSLPLVGVWQHWDACWYTKISTFGYAPGDNTVNFWPLFPLLVGIMQVALGGAAALAGLVVAGVAYLVAMLGLDRLIARDLDPDVGRWTIVLISAFPTAFFFFAPFTESLFLACAVWSVVGARERKWLLAAGAGYLAAMTRIQGVVLVLPIAWEVAVVLGGRAAAPHVRAHLPRRTGMPLAWRVALALRSGAGGEPHAVKGAPIGLAASGPRIPSLAQAIAVAAPALGFATFLAYSNAVAGQTPLETQDAWGGRDFHLPWDVVAASWDWAVRMHDPLQALNLIMLLLFGVLVVAGLRRLPFAYFLYAAPQIALLATRIQPTPLTSTARYVLVLFPAFALIATIRDVRFRLAWLAGSVVLMAVLASSFLHGNFVA